MRTKPHLLLSVAAALLAGACTLITDFGLEGVACDPTNPCLAGFGCVEGECMFGADAGVDCAACASGQCAPFTNECLPPSCDQRICAAGYQCEIPTGAGVDGVPQCKSVPEGQLGQFCFSDQDCRRSGNPAHLNRLCMRGAIQLQTTGQLRSGVCVEPCGTQAECTTEGASCREFVMGADAGATRVCLPRYALIGCANDKGCELGQLVCTVFDHPQVGPLTACDQPLNAGAPVGAPCTRTTGDGGTLCANGLCVPQVTTVEQPSFCGELCDTTTCSLGTCELVGFGVENVIRYVPMCLAAPSRCQSCAAGAGACFADAPRCSTVGIDQVCLGGCTPAQSGPFQCPPGYTCTPSGAGGMCQPSGGSCL